MSKQKILAADDDDIMRDMLRIFLEARGFEITTVENGKQAVEKEEEIRPDLVILDVDMPVMTGFDACPLIRHKRNGINYTPIIFLSGNLDERSVITGLQAGADDYIRKPFEPLELLNRIKNLLRMRDFIAHLESLENVIFSLVKSIEARDSYTAGHSMRVSNIAVALGRQRGLSDEDIESLRKGALLHDIG
jgi:putative two-component system response regulator